MHDKNTIQLYCRYDEPDPSRDTGHALDLEQLAMHFCHKKNATLHRGLFFGGVFVGRHYYTILYYTILYYSTILKSYTTADGDVAKKSNDSARPSPPNNVEERIMAVPLWNQEIHTYTHIHNHLSHEG